MKIVIVKVHESELRETVTNHINEALRVDSDGGDFHNYHRFFFHDGIETEAVVKFSYDNPNMFVRLIEEESYCTLLAGKVVGKTREVPPHFADYLEKLYLRVSQQST